MDLLGEVGMDKQAEDLNRGKINAGRGVAKKQESNSDTESSAEKNKDKDRPDDRARKAGY